MVPYPAEVTEIDIDGRTFWVRPVGSWVLDRGNVVAKGLRYRWISHWIGLSGSFSGTWNSAWNFGR